MIVTIKKHWKLAILIILISSIIIYRNSSLVMKNLPTGELISELVSPNKENTLKAYLFSGGATMDWTLRVEVVNNNTGKSKNIYWKYHDEKAIMEWLDNTTVIINGIKLNIYKDWYIK